MWPTSLIGCWEIDTVVLGYPNTKGVQTATQSPPPGHQGIIIIIIITRVSEVIMFSPCVFVTLFVSLSRCLSGRFNYEGLVPHKQYFAGTLLGMSSCASYVSRTHDVIDDVTRSQSRSNVESDISPSIFKLEHRSQAQNVGNAHGYLPGLFNFRYNFR